MKKFKLNNSVHSMSIFGDYCFCCTCSACPEQYDVYDFSSYEVCSNLNQVAYIRERMNNLEVRCPDYKGKVVYSSYLGDNEKIEDHINEIITAIKMGVN